MKVILHHGNVLDLSVEALVVTVDGAAPGMEGNIGRQLRARIGDDTWADVESQIVYPFPIRRMQVADIEHPSVAFKKLLVVDVLNHGRGTDFKFALGRAVHAAFEVADRMKFQGIACPILHGGWRSKPVDGLYTILRAASAFTGPELHLATQDEEVFAVARTVIGT